MSSHRSDQMCTNYILNQGQIPLKKDKKGGEGRRCCLLNRIYSIICCASCFALGRFEEKDEFILFFKNCPSAKLVSWQGIE